MKIAVATRNGVDIDEHFGKAKAFYIYDTSGTKTEFLEIRKVNKYCVSDEKTEHAFIPDKLDTIVEALADCSKIYVNKIGPKPLLELTNKNFDVVEYTGPISDIC